MSAATISAKQAREELLGTDCKGCGKSKQPAMSHCRKCYLRLPKPLRSALYRRIGQGYEAAYAESLVVLRRTNGDEVQPGLGLS